jgi:hypothetical protein
VVADVVDDGELLVACGLAELVFETGLESPNLLLEIVHARLQLEQLGAKGHLVEARFDPVQPLFDAFQASYDHVVLGLELVEALVDGVEVAVDLVEPAVDRVETHVHLGTQAIDQPLYVGQDDLPMELREGLDQVFHVPILLQPQSQWVRKRDRVAAVEWLEVGGAAEGLDGGEEHVGVGVAALAVVGA